MEKILKNLTSKTDLLFIVVALMITCSFVGCQSNVSESSDDLAEISIKKDFLVVERHQVLLDRDYSITADLPISNYAHLEHDSQYLSDSVSSLINYELHSLLDGSSKTYPNDPIVDLDHLKDEYERLKEEYVGGQWISFILIAQTESFVTYGLEYYHCAGSCGSEFCCYTFSKKDGRRINNLITWEDIMRFVNDHPKANLPFSQWQLEAGYDDVNASHLYDAGLLNDGLLLVNEDEVNHYIVGKIAYKDILPYLSKEAQELVRAMGDGVEYNRNRWYLGRCIGELNRDDTKIRLMQREPLWHGFSNLNTSDDESFFKDKAYSLTAYEERDIKYIPTKIFVQKNENEPKASLELMLPEGDWEGPSFDDVFFTLDDKILYAPYLKEKNKVGITPFKFDGHLFKQANAEDTKPQGSIY